MKVKVGDEVFIKDDPDTKEYIRGFDLVKNQVDEFFKKSHIISRVYKEPYLKDTRHYIMFCGVDGFLYFYEEEIRNVVSEESIEEWV